MIGHQGLRLMPLTVSTALSLQFAGRFVLSTIQCSLFHPVIRIVIKMFLVPTPSLNLCTVKTQIEEKCARTLELPLLVRRLVHPFYLVPTGAEFAVLSPHVAEKGNSNVLAHFSSI